VSVKMPADRVSTQVLPLADSLSAVVKREKYHTIKDKTLFVMNIFMYGLVLSVGLGFVPYLS